MRTLVLGLVVFAGCVPEPRCVPEAKSNQCAFCGELSGSEACEMSSATWDSGSNRTLMRLGTVPGASGAVVEVTIAFEGAPVVGERTIGTTASAPERGQPGCNVWFFHLEPPLGDDTRNAQTFGGDERVDCELNLTEVVALDGTQFTVHGSVQSGVVGGASVFSPLRRAKLVAGF